jgi:hypothetical protein
MRRTADRTKFALDAKIALHRLAPAPADAWLPVPPAGSPSSAGQADKRARWRPCEIANRDAAGISVRSTVADLGGPPRYSGAARFAGPTRPYGFRSRLAGRELLRLL